MGFEMISPAETRTRMSQGYALIADGMRRSGFTRRDRSKTELGCAVRIWVNQKSANVDFLDAFLFGGNIKESLRILLEGLNFRGI